MMRIALLLIAVISGVTAAWLATRPRQESAVAIAAPAPPASLPMQDVLVASADLRPAQPLTSENMRWKTWPENAVSPTYIIRSNRPDALKTLAGSLVRSRMTTDEPVREENLVSRHSSYLAAILPSGMRALGVRISAESAAGHFIVPGSRVDVLHTEGGEYASRTILWNVLVLAIDQIVDESNRDEKGKASMIGKTATLELDSAQAEVLTAAQAKGNLSLSLRSAADDADNRKQRSKAPPRIIRAGRSETIKIQ